MIDVATFGKPYWEDGEIRTFDISKEILEGDGWQFQLDGCLPWLLEKGMVFDITKLELHRLIKGINTLRIRIVKRG